MKEVKKTNNFTIEKIKKRLKHNGMMSFITPNFTIKKFKKRIGFYFDLR